MFPTLYSVSKEKLLPNKVLQRFIGLYLWLEHCHISCRKQRNIMHRVGRIETNNLGLVLAINVFEFWTQTSFWRIKHNRWSTSQVFSNSNMLLCLTQSRLGDVLGRPSGGFRESFWKASKVPEKVPCKIGSGASAAKMITRFCWLWREAFEGGSGKVPRKVQKRSPTDPFCWEIT